MAALGDIAIVGYGADTTVKSFAFVLLADLGGETIHFTDNGWFATGGFRAGEGVVSYPVAAGTPIGTVITISGLTGNLNPSTTGDQITAYTGTVASPTFLFAIDFADGNVTYAGDATSSNTSAVPTGLTFGETALAFGADNAAYTGPTSGSRTDILAAIADEANWTTDDASGVAYPSSFAVATGAPGTFGVADASVDEGDVGGADLTFTVTRVGGSTGTVTVDYAAAFDTANAGDLSGALPAGTLTFADGETEKVVTVQVTGDTTAEPDETITLTLSNPTGGASVGDGSATGTIRNDDAAAPVSGTPWINEFHYDDLMADNGEFIEIAGPAGLDLTGYTVHLYNGSNGTPYGVATLSGLIPDQGGGFGTVAVTYADTAGGTLQNGAPDGFALVAPDETTVIQFLSYEGPLTATSGPAAGMTSTDVGVSETASTPEGSSLGLVGTGSKADDFTWAVIADDTPGGINQGQTFAALAPQLSVSDLTFAEGDSGSKVVEFTVTRSGGEGAFSVAYETANGTATAGVDYQATSGTLAFAAGENAAKVQVTVLGDATPEADETFFLRLSSPTNGAVLADDRGRATITNDDGAPPTISIGDASVLEGDSGTTLATFTVTRTGGTNAFTVAYATVGNSAEPGSDFASTSGTLSFAEGQTEQQITVSVTGDALAESDELFFVTLSSPTGDAVIADPRGEGIIRTDDYFRISDIQGPAAFSPILAAEGVAAFNTASATTVTIQAVITALDGTGARQGFYLMEETADWDDNALTSEGIFLMTRTDGNVGTTLAAAAPEVRVGDLVTVTGRVTEYQAFQNLPRTMMVDPVAITITASGQPLPTLVLDGSAGRSIPSRILTDETPNYFDSVGGPDFDPQNDALDFFETVEGMRVMVPDMVAADGFVSLSGGDAFFKAYSLVHADAGQINSRGGYTIGGDPALSAPNTVTTSDDVRAGGQYVHDGDVNPDVLELDFSDFATPAPAGLADQISMGDRLGDVTGILDFDFTDLKLYVTDPIVPVVDTTPVREVTTIEADARSLTVATFNVENLDPTDGTARFAAIAQAIAVNLKAPDILTIEEIQDNNGAAAGDGASVTGTDASQTWQLLVDAVNAATGQAYQWIDEAPVYNAEGGEPGGNIRVGFLYNTNRVQLGGLAADATLAERRAYTDRIGDGVRADGDLIAFDDGMIGGEINTADWSNTRKSLLGEFTFSGNAVYVLANHLPSKGGSGTFWQVDQSLPEDPSNAGWAKRNEIAEDLYLVMSAIQSGSADNRIVAGGDFNEFQFNRALEAATGYVNAEGAANPDGVRFDNLTLTELSEAERYTYAFDGRSQAIDHVLADQRLSAVASYDVVHINTGYNSRGGDNPALSDHDPAQAQFDFRSFGELLRGTAAGETIDGLGGDDRLFGLGGADRLNGGIGNDRLEGGAGTDVLTGGKGADLFVFGGDLGGSRDRIADLGTEDAIVTTVQFFDGNGDGTITRGRNKTFEFAQGGSVAITAASGATVTRLSYEGSYLEDGVTYYVYGLLGAAPASLSPADMRATIEAY